MEQILTRRPGVVYADREKLPLFVESTAQNAAGGGAKAMKKQVFCQVLTIIKLKISGNP